MKYNKKPFLQKAVICKKTKGGYFTVSYLNHLLFKYEIRENQVNGIGIVYYLYENTPAAMATFSNNRLNGISIIYSKNGRIESMQIFKKGKYKRYIYFSISQTEKALEKANKNLFTNPYMEIRYKEIQTR
jgi:antitoxin component YwqK of YwqJK toxin-antitoxin module